MRPGFLAYCGVLGLGIVGKRPAFLPAAQFILGRLVEPKKWEPLFLPASSACPSGFPRCDVGGLLPTWYPHPAICPLWAFPMATHEEPEPIPPKRSLRLRPWKRGREESMGAGVEAGISFWIGGGAGGLAEAAPPHPTASRPPSPTRGEGEARRAGISFCGAHPLLSSLSGLTRQSATLLRALKGLGSLRRGGTHICCACGSLAGPRVEPEDDEGG